jgi:hypothetical protein
MRHVGKAQIMACSGGAPAPLVCRRPPPCRICPTCCCHSLHTKGAGTQDDVRVNNHVQTLMATITNYTQQVQLTRDMHSVPSMHSEVAAPT